MFCFVTHGRFSALVAGLLLLSGCMLGPDYGPEHVFELDEAPAFLSDELALGKAREALAMDKQNPDEWQSRRGDTGQTKAPDGVRDIHLERFRHNPAQGHITFAKMSEKRKPLVRRYWVRLEGNRLVCAYQPGL